MDLNNLQKDLKIEFINFELLTQAFVHRSFLNEDKTVKHSNERLEFLGDAILSFLTSEYLYNTYPEYPEGMLTNIRSGMVNTKTLANLAKKLNFGLYLFLSRGELESGGRSNQSLLADCFEAFLGALYLDQGIEPCRKFLSQNLFYQSENIIKNKAYIDFKSRLQEIIQETIKESPVYKVIKSEGPDHDKTFTIEVISQGDILGQGIGKSKQEAQQNAARCALEKQGKIW